ncbi:hypothetical protein SAMN05216337_1017121 [Bradyrhizobium brasilense]|uniref:Uncharacterized protein n=1 Tax=Bradyrhizobium brasilense TaxID=1419277 RepID=A0A1G6YYF3_9BRAD|nr:hypothetical protein [Bradyrhizobium brasilense]SDD94665.1 hypothetical protein SAMN05216337_1017121 [Bradyrhizobium brasilense]
MAKYRKKPVVIDAMQFTGGRENAVAVMAFAGLPESAYTTLTDGTEFLWVGTLEGAMRADVRDWIIRGVKGEVYPCKPDIFEVTYDHVPDGPARPSSPPSQHMVA